jgi:6-phosphogluconate dehydrogenase
MQMGLIGLGRMGGNMARRLMLAGHSIVGYARDAEAVGALVKEGATGAGSVAELVKKLAPPRIAWVMVPAGAATEETVLALGDAMSPGDVVIDGGNSWFKDDVRRAALLAQKGISYLDVGTSGGVWGLERGYCMMVGGPPEAFRRAQPLLAALAPGRGQLPRTPGRANRAAPGSTAEEGYIHCGPTGSGHYVKMIHNGIEYGLMQAYAEGFDIFRNAASPALAPEIRYSLDLAEIAEVWRRGSVVSSWLLDLTAAALLEDPALSQYTGYVQDSGEGRWTIQAALEEAVPADVLTASLYTRFRSRQDHTFAEKILSAMRKQFGGHVERPAGG